MIYNEFFKSLMKRFKRTDNVGISPEADCKISCHTTLLTKYIHNTFELFVQILIGESFRK